MKSFSKLSVNYSHPEIEAKTSASAAFGRKYFKRSSEPEREDDDTADEKSEIFAEMLSLKNLEVDYVQPESGVKTIDGAAVVRN